MKPIRKLSIHAITATGLLGAICGASAADRYTDGHGDFGIAFEDDTEWFIHYHLDSSSVVNGSLLPGDAEFPPSEIVLELSASAKVLLPIPLSFLGASAGDEVWIIPQVQSAGVPFFGLATEELDAMWGNITFALTSFSGPGQFALWSTGSFGAANVKMQTNDGVDSLFDREVIPPGTHAHYNWGFTQPGTYELGITVSSTHPTFGFQSGTETITVHVVPEPGSTLLLGLGLLGFALCRPRQLFGEKFV